MKNAFFFRDDRYKETIINKFNKPKNIKSYIKQVKKIFYLKKDKFTTLIKREIV